MANPRCLHATSCGGGEIRGKVYFLRPSNKPGVVEDLPACIECAKPVLGPKINRKLSDAVVLLSTFGDIIPELLELGSVEIESGQVKRVRGRLGGVAAAFKEGRDLYQVISAASTVLAQAQHRIARRFLETIERLYPKAYPSFRDRVRHQRNFARQRHGEAAVFEQQIETHFSRRSIVPRDIRGGFLGSANDAFHNSLQVLVGLGKSFRKQKKAAQVDPQDAPLIEKVVGFDPTKLVSKPEDHVDEKAPLEAAGAMEAQKTIAEATAGIAGAVAPTAPPEEPQAEAKPKRRTGSRRAKPPEVSAEEHRPKRTSRRKEPKAEVGAEEEPPEPAAEVTVGQTTETARSYVIAEAASDEPEWKRQLGAALQNGEFKEGDS